MVKDWKIKFVDELAGKIKAAKIVGVANVGRLPSRQMQAVRQGLRGHASVDVIKRSLLKRAFEKAGVEMDIPNKPALVMSDIDAFELFRIIKSKRGVVAAKPGMISPKEVVVKEGGTGLPPGPAIADLQNAGIPAKIEKGQIVVIKDHVILHAGDAVTPEIANALMKLDMKPFELGLDVIAILDNGTLFKADVLNVDLDEIVARIGKASTEAFSLAHEIAYPVKEVLEMLLGEINAQAKSLALSVDWVSKDTVKAVLSKASSQAVSLNKKIGGV